MECIKCIKCRRLINNLDLAQQTITGELVCQHCCNFQMLEEERSHTELILQAVAQGFSNLPPNYKNED